MGVPRKGTRLFLLGERGKTSEEGRPQSRQIEGSFNNRNYKYVRRQRLAIRKADRSAASIMLVFLAITELRNRLSSRNGML